MKTPGFKQVAMMLAAMALTACGGMGKSEMAKALETAWSEDAVGLAASTGTNLPGAEPGELRGVAGSAKIATEVVQNIAGDTGGRIASETINGASRIAEDFGISGAHDVRAAVGIATARDWKVRNLEVLSERDSGEDHVANVRYDLSASIEGAPVTIAKDITHEARFVHTDDGWRLEKQQ